MPESYYKPGKKFEVVKATKRPIKGLALDDKQFKFGRNGGFYVNDPGVARELERTYGHKKGNGDVVISEIRVADVEGHNYFFPIPEVPWRSDRWNPEEDPEWEEVKPGVWRRRKNGKAQRETKKADS